MRKDRYGPMGITTCGVGDHGKASNDIVQNRAYETVFGGGWEDRRAGEDNPPTRYPPSLDGYGGARVCASCSLLAYPRWLVFGRRL